MNRILRKNELLIIFMLLFFIVCVEYISRTSSNKYEPVYLYPEDLLKNKAITVNTNNETYKIVVKAGENLSQIIQSTLKNYLINQGSYNEYEEFDLTNVIYNIVNNTKIKSGNSDLIFIGETLYVILPAMFTIYKKISAPIIKHYNVNELRRLLNSLKWLKPYCKGTWDCSNMSGFLAQYLVQQGWDAYIVSGQKYGSLHSWVQVRVSPDKGQYIDIEATGIFIDQKSPRSSSGRYRPWEQIKENSSEYGWGHLEQPLMGRRE